MVAQDTEPINLMDCHGCIGVCGERRAIRREGNEIQLLHCTHLDSMRVVVEFHSQVVRIGIDAVRGIRRDRAPTVFVYGCGKTRVQGCWRLPRCGNRLPKGRVTDVIKLGLPPQSWCAA